MSELKPLIQTKDPYLSPHRKWSRSVSTSSKNTEGETAPLLARLQPSGRSPTSSLLYRLGSPKLKPMTLLDRISGSSISTIKSGTLLERMDLGDLRQLKSPGSELSDLSPQTEPNHRRGRKTTIKTSRGSCERTLGSISSSPTSGRKPLSSLGPIRRISNSLSRQSSPRPSLLNSRARNGQTLSPGRWSTSTMSSLEDSLWQAITVTSSPSAVSSSNSEPQDPSSMSKMLETGSLLGGCSLKRSHSLSRTDSQSSRPTRSTSLDSSPLQP